MVQSTRELVIRGLWRSGLPGRPETAKFQACRQCRVAPAVPSPDGSRLVRSGRALVANRVFEAFVWTIENFETRGAVVLGDYGGPVAS